MSLTYKEKFDLKEKFLPFDLIKDLVKSGHLPKIKENFGQYDLSVLDTDYVFVTAGKQVILKNINDVETAIKAISLTYHPNIPFIYFYPTYTLLEALKKDFPEKVYKYVKEEILEFILKINEYLIPKKFIVLENRIKCLNIILTFQDKYILQIENNVKLVEPILIKKAVQEILKEYVFNLKEYINNNHLVIFYKENLKNILKIKCNIYKLDFDENIRFELKHKNSVKTIDPKITLNENFNYLKEMLNKLDILLFLNGQFFVI